MALSPQMSPQELARRFAEADKMVVLLRRATLDLRVAGEFVLAERRREFERSRRDGAVRR